MTKESIPGILIFLAAIISMLITNSSISQKYLEFLNQEIIGHFSLVHIVNDFLMAIFFFLIALEIKKEILIGKLSTAASVLSPTVAAVLGMFIPALFFYGLNYNHQDSNVMNGWAIPSATDIAFSLAVLNLVGKAVPKELKLFLLTLAIIDDLGAIIIIAIFYSESIDINSLLIVVSLLALLIVISYLKIKHLIIYYVIGIVMLYFAYTSGIHTTIIGVLIGLTIPLDISKNKKKKDYSYYTIENSPLVKSEKKLLIPVNFFILPLFSTVNATLILDFNTEFTSVTNGIIYGLTLGKLIGIFSLLFIIDKIGRSNFPKDTSIFALMGLSLLCGIGFTMSLFINSLAYSDHIHYLNQAKLGIFVGSILSGIIGFIFLKIAYWKK